MIAAGDAVAAMRARIAGMLDDIERDHRVRIVLAVESGSRAWGFPSSDSDWDVRFLYLRPLAAYLRVDSLPDVVEVPLKDELDLNGWDLRKALALVAASNAVVLEWLASPVVYRRDEALCQQMAILARAAAHLPALSYHYDRLARRHWVAPPGASVRFKTLFYALRPALALAWVRRHGGPPPMDLDGLVAGLELPSALMTAVDRLRALKLTATEAGITSVPDVVRSFLDETLIQPVARAAAWDRSEALVAINDAFFEMLTHPQFRFGTPYLGR